MADSGSRFTRPNPQDDAIDAALDAATAQSKAPPQPDVPFKRQWDDELEAELEKALEGFDETKYEVRTPRRERGADRSQESRAERGQETRSGPQSGKVIGVRGRSVFVDLGAKSEGIVPVEQFGPIRSPTPAT